MDHEGKKIGIIIVVVLGLLVLAGGGIYFGLAATGNEISEDTNENLNVTENVNTDLPVNSNTNVDDSAVTTKADVVVSGRVYTKGYSTPSESFGILTVEGLEIGLGSYDSMREQIRSYIGESIEVTFASVCRSSTEDCCRTLFPLCGEVSSWKPL